MCLFASHLLGCATLIQLSTSVLFHRIAPSQPFRSKVTCPSSGNSWTRTTLVASTLSVVGSASVELRSNTAGSAVSFLLSTSPLQLQKQRSTLAELGKSVGSPNAQCSQSHGCCIRSTELQSTCVTTATRWTRRGHNGGKLQQRLKSQSDKLVGRSG